MVFHNRYSKLLPSPSSITSLSCIALVLVSTSNCKGRSSAQTRIKDSGACSSQITDRQDQELVAQVAGIQQQYFTGQILLEERNSQIGNLVNTTKPATNPQAFMALAAGMESANTAAILPYLMTMQPDDEISPALLSMLQGMGVEPIVAQDFIDTQLDRIAPAMKTLNDVGASFAIDHGWDISGLHLNVAALVQDAKLRTSISLVWSAQTLASLEKKDRKEALTIDNGVIMPADSNGDLKVLPKDYWNQSVKQWLVSFQNESTDFITATRSANSYGGLTQGRLIDLFGGQRGYQGKSAAEIKAAGAWNNLQNVISKLQSLGVSGELLKSVNDTQQILINLEGASIQQGLQKLDAARNAAIAAPLIPLALYAAPFAGGLMGPGWATTIANASTTMAVMPMMYGMGNLTLSVASQAISGNGSVSCDFYEKFVAAGASSITSAAMGAWIPVAAAGAAGGVSIVVPGGNVAASTYGYLNIGLAANSLVGMVNAGVNGAKACYSKIQSLQNAAIGGSVTAATDDTIKSCLQAGIDVGFAIVQTAYFTGQALDALKKHSADQIQACPTGMGLGLVNVRSFGKCVHTPEEKAASEARTKYVQETVVPEDNQLKGKVQLTDQEALAIQAYGGAMYHDINQQLNSSRDAFKNPSPNVTAVVQALDGLMQRTNVPGGITLHRGDILNQTPNVGDQIGFPSYLSTSLDQQVGDNFAAIRWKELAKGRTAVVYHITVPQGATAHGIYVNDTRVQFSEEHELILPHGTQIKVTGVSAPTQRYNSKYDVHYPVLDVNAELVPN